MSGLVLILLILLAVSLDLVIRRFTVQEVAPIPEEICPPHKWRHAELKDDQGNLVMWKLECERCKLIP